MDQHWARPRSLSLQYFMFIIWAGLSLIILYFIFLWLSTRGKWKRISLKGRLLQTSCKNVHSSLFVVLALALDRAYFSIWPLHSASVSSSGPLELCLWIMYVPGPAPQPPSPIGPQLWPPRPLCRSQVASIVSIAMEMGRDQTQTETHENEKWAWAGGHLSKQESVLNISWEPLASHI